ncbi:unnamed protein product [Vitrella brassicaformis CCMP3155]|uniref:Uncharacterized protein n=1 Tax=Vitrella brassicaformis (strain CCMP3155) TaxID=1169540 RepID=A0A0G4FSZ5_VITBC|nr:unnamed protein product [Vitrella brassicaformis CCMP3155]|eukprot:CEM17787.1 unnamed protein product [Vitrella brassicaformis CCMP3155]
MVVDAVFEAVWAFPHTDVTEEVVTEPGSLFVGDRRFRFDNGGERHTLCRVCGTHGRAEDNFITQHYHTSTRCWQRVMEKLMTPYCMAQHTAPGPPGQHPQSLPAPVPLIADSHPPTGSIKPTGTLPGPQLPHLQPPFAKQLRGLDHLSRVLRCHLEMVDEQRRQALNLLATPNKPQAVEQNLRVWERIVDNQAKHTIRAISQAVPALIAPSAEKLRLIQALLGTQLRTQDGTQAIDCADDAVLCVQHEPCLEGIPEVLWLSDGYRTGIGGYLGFVACVKSLSGVSTAIASTVSNPKMHPILLLDSTKRFIRCPQPIHRKWKDVLSRTSSVCVSINAGPHIVSVGLLEAAAGNVTEITVDPKADRTSQFRFGKSSLAASVRFPRLAKAVLTREWVEVVMQRQSGARQVYEMPALTNLSVEWPAPGGLKMLKRAGGLQSLHLLDQVSADRHEYTSLTAIVQSLLGTPSHSTIKSLTGAVHLSFDSKSSPLTGLECLEGVSCTTTLDKAFDVEDLHKFRSTWLAKGAKELYHAGQVDNGDLRLVRRATRECPAPRHVHLPLIGKPEQLAGARPTLQLLTTSATHVTLSPYLLDEHATGASELYGLSFKQAADLYVRRE